MTRLETIATRQRKLRTRDLLFAMFVVVAAAVGATSVATACNTATTTHIVHR